MSLDERRLVMAGWAFALASAIHVTDHLRRGQGSVSDALFLLGNLALVLQVVAVTLVVTRHRTAPLVAVAAGVPLSVGFAAAHWLPEWSALSDPVWEVDSASWFSSVASGAEILGAVALAIAGWTVVRERGGLAAFGGPAPGPAREA